MHIQICVSTCLQIFLLFFPSYSESRRPSPFSRWMRLTGYPAREIHCKRKMISTRCARCCSKLLSVAKINWPVSDTGRFPLCVWEYFPFYGYGADLWNSFSNLYLTLNLKKKKNQSAFTALTEMWVLKCSFPDQYLRTKCCFWLHRPHILTGILPDVKDDVYKWTRSFRIHFPNFEVSAAFPLSRTHSSSSGI